MTNAGIDDSVSQAGGLTLDEVLDHAKHHALWAVGYGVVALAAGAYGTFQLIRKHPFKAAESYCVSAVAGYLSLENGKAESYYWDEAQRLQKTED